MDDLRHHAEHMMQMGITVEEAASRYVVPARFRQFEIFSWTWTIEAALQSYYAGLARS